MKKMLYAAVLLALTVACSGPKHDGYTINGTLTGITEGKVILANMARTEVITDTAEIKDGKFTFIGKLNTPENYRLTINEKHMQFFLDNSTITVTGNIDSLQTAEIKGSKLGDEIKAMNDKKKALRDAFTKKHRTDELMKEYYNAATTAARKDEIKEIFNGLNAEQRVLNGEINAIDSIYMKENPNSPYTAILLAGKVGEYEGPDKINVLSALVDSMAVAPALAGNRYVKETQEAVKIIKSVEVGQIAPDFTQNDPTGKPVTFSDVYKKNKITMIDFWASWCGPCRAFNPALVKIYNKYQKKGFEIFAVSFDGKNRNETDVTNAKERWMKAIESDKLTWVHVSDLQFWENAVGKLYYVRYIPQNVFVDANGKIIAKRLGEEEIQKFLDENLK